MAMRRGGGFAPSRPRVVVRPVFEDFKPMSERKQEKESEIIIVRLPGFLREQIRLSMESTNVLRIRGQRLVAGNKWSRFQQDFDIPENCIVGGIRAKFDGGVFTITMPRKTISEKSEANTSQKAQNSKDAAGVPKPPKVQEDIQEKPDSNPETEKQRVGKRIRPPSPKKGESEPKPQKVQDKTLEASGPHKGPSEAKSQNETTPELKMPENARLVVSVDKEKSNEASKESSKAENVIKKVEREKEKSDTIVGDYKEKNKDDPNGGRVQQKTDTIGGSTSGGYKYDDYKEAMKGLAKGLNEERQLMVNMGAAVLVILALGVYIYYTSSSSAKANDY